jgi:serine/threonine-protein kinase
MLGDFGVAHLPDETGETGANTKRAEAVGTLAYMSPEQRRGVLTPAADIYATAVVLFENLTARTPWERALMAGVRKADDLRLPEFVFKGIPRDIAEEVQHHIQRMGDPDPSKRPTTAQALVEAQRLRERVIAAGGP